MCVDVLVKTQEAEKIRKILDPLADAEPIVGIHDKIPDTTFLSYASVPNPKILALAAMEQGAYGVSL
jgi:hypothetical protein